MKNLLWGIENVNNRERAERLAEMEVYRCKNLLRHCFKLISWVVVTVWNKAAKKDLPPKPVSLEDEVYDDIQTIVSLSDVDEKNLMYKRLAKRLHCKVKSEYNDDANSAMITKKACKYLKKGQIQGLSHYEINQLIHKEYPAKKFDNRKFLNLYGIISALIMVLSITLAIIIGKNGLAVLAGGIICLIATAITCDVRIRKNCLFGFIWLAVSGVNSTESFVKADNTGRQGMEEDFRAVHTLNILIDSGDDNILTAQKKIESLKNSLEKNKRIISETEDERIKNDKYIENNKIQEDVDSLTSDIGKIRANNEKLQKRCNEILEILSIKLSEYWYVNLGITLDQNIVCKIITLFSYKDLDIIEQRFRELTSNKAPESIAKNDHGSLCVEFRTHSSGIGRLYFILNNNTVSFADVSCTEKLNEEQLDVEKLEKVLSNIASEKQSSPSEDLLAYIQKLKSQIENEKIRAAKQVENLNGEIGELQKQRDEVVAQMSNIQEEYDNICNLAEERRVELAEAETRLQEMENNAERDATEIAELKGLVEKKRNEIDLLEKKANEYIQKITKLTNIVDETESKLVITIDEERKRAKEFIEQKEREFEIEKGKLKDQIIQLNTSLSEKSSEIESKNEDIASKENAINAQEALLRKLSQELDVSKKSESKENDQLKNTIEKLKRTLESEKEKREKAVKEKRLIQEEADCVKRELQKTKTNYNEALLTQNRINEENNNHLKEIEKLSAAIDKSRIKVLQNQEIVKAFYDMVLKAQKSVYMIFPGMSYPSKGYQQNPKPNAFTRMADVLQRAFIAHPELKVVIFYGLKDTGHAGNLERAEKAIKEYKKIPGADNIIFEETNTHIKLAIADEETYILGSMNLLTSPDYYESKKLHSEIAVISKDKNVADELVTKYFSKYRMKSTP